MQWPSTRNQTLDLPNISWIELPSIQSSLGLPNYKVPNFHSTSNLIFPLPNVHCISVVSNMIDFVDNVYN